MLQVNGLNKSFSGFKAVNGANLEVKQGEIVAVIGPNGAGKTTLFNLITGIIKPDGGDVIFRGERITGLPAYKTCKKGLTRSFQVVNIFNRQTVFENVQIAVLVQQKKMFSLFSPARNIAVRETMDILESVGLATKKDRICGVLSHGDRKVLEIAMALVNPAAISHWSALHHYGLTEQIPRKVYVLTTTGASVPRTRGTKVERVSDGYPVGDTVYQFVQVKPERYFGTQKVWVDEARVTATDPERTLLDGLSKPQYCGDFAEVLHAFEARGTALDVERIVGYALRLDAATAKRLGWVLEQQGVDSSKLERLAAIFIKGYRKLDPTGPRKGPYSRQWMIQENLQGKVSI